MKHIREGAHTIDNKQSIEIFKINKTIKICLDNITTNIQIYSFEQMDFDLLLGIDWCIATKATFDFSKNKINTSNGIVNTLESDFIKQKNIMDTILSSDSKLNRLYERFFFKEVSLPNHRDHDCKIILKDRESFKTRPHKKFSINKLAYIKKYLDDNIQKDFFRQTKSPRALPILLVPKKNPEL
jgi:hypothetical protein